MSKSNNQNTFLKPNPTTPTFINPETEIQLVWERGNKSYTIIENEVLEGEVTESYKDILLRDLDPNIEKETPIFGKARVFKPTTQIINEMKNTIDKAGGQLEDFKNQVKEYYQNLKQTDQQTQTTEQKGDNTNG